MGHWPGRIYHQAGAKIGDSIKLERQRQQAVTIQIPERDQNGLIIGQTEKQVNRKTSCNLRE